MTSVSKTAEKSALTHAGLRLALLRQLHIWISVFVAPSLIFFSVTGAFQTFRVPDRKDSPVLLTKLARVHRDDVFALKPAPPPKKAEPEKAKAKPAEAPKAKPKEKPATFALKVFFVLTSLAIAITTLLGVWMAAAYAKNKAVVWGLLIAGAAIPVLLIAAAA